MSASNPESAWNDFYKEYGQAMLAWQILESEIATLFSFLTKIPPAMSTQIYYSSRSFQGRIDIFKGGLTAAQMPAEIKSFARAIINKARKYSEYRNKFAHDQPLLSQQGSPLQKSVTFDIVMVDGKGQFQSDEVKKQYMNEAVPVSEITHAAVCFRQLADLTRDFWAHYRSQSPYSRPQNAWLGTLQERLLALPNLPRKAALFPPPAKPSTPPKASGG
jgi:hypothetical protein